MKRRPNLFACAMATIIVVILLLFWLSLWLRLRWHMPLGPEGLRAPLVMLGRPGFYVLEWVMQERYYDLPWLCLNLSIIAIDWIFCFLAFRALAAIFGLAKGVDGGGGLSSIGHLVSGFQPLGPVAVLTQPCGLGCNVVGPSALGVAAGDIGLSSGMGPRWVCR